MTAFKTDDLLKLKTAIVHGPCSDGLASAMLLKACLMKNNMDNIELPNQCVEAPKESGFFCDFCDCEDCRDGSELLYHASTTDNKWICDVCWTYDLCTSNNNPFGVDRNPDGPCPSNVECRHRPRLSGPWIKGKRKANQQFMSDHLALVEAANNVLPHLRKFHNAKDSKCTGCKAADKLEEALSALDKGLIK